MAVKRYTVLKGHVDFQDKKGKTKTAVPGGVAFLDEDEVESRRLVEEGVVALADSTGGAAGDQEPDE